MPSVDEMIRERGQKVTVKAVAFGTISGPYGVLHMDPEGVDPRAKAGSFYPAEALALEAAGIGKRVKTLTVEIDEDGNAVDLDGNAVPALAAKRMGEMTDMQVEAGIDTPVLDSRSTTLYGDNRLATGVADVPEADDDADAGEEPAPVTGRRGRPRRAASTEE
jgi:hypothetical protein